MKTKPINMYITIKKNVIFIFMCLLLVYSCTKDKIVSDENHEAQIFIKSISIESQKDSSQIKIANILNEKILDKNQSEKVLNDKLIYNNEFDQIVTFHNNTTDENNSNVSKIYDNRKLASNENINHKTKFRLIIYDEKKLNKPVYNQILTINTQPNIKLHPNTNYRWYAISTNDEYPPSINDKGQIEKSEISNKDLIIASNTISTIPGDNYLNILFKRKTAKIEITINTRGLFGSITDDTEIALLQNDNSLIQSGDYSIFENKYVNIKQDDNSISANNWINISDQWVNYEKKAIFYSHENDIRTIPSNSLYVRLNKLNIILDDNTIRTFSPNTLIPLQNKRSLILEKGKSASSDIKLIESAILVNQTYWARTDLHYDRSKLNGQDYDPTYSNAYRFKPNNEYDPNITYYDNWRMNAATPWGVIQDETVDVCEKVYPQNTWKMPSRQDFEGLIKEHASRIITKQTINLVETYATEYAIENNKMTNVAYPNKYLTFPHFYISQFYDNADINNLYKNEYFGIDPVSKHNQYYYYPQYISQKINRHLSFYRTLSKMSDIASNNYYISHFFEYILSGIENGNYSMLPIPRSNEIVQHPVIVDATALKDPNIRHYEFVFPIRCVRK